MSEIVSTQTRKLQNNYALKYAIQNANAVQKHIPIEAIKQANIIIHTTVKVNETYAIPDTVPKTKS